MSSELKKTFIPPIQITKKNARFSHLKANFAQNVDGNGKFALLTKFDKISSLDWSTDLI